MKVSSLPFSLSVPTFAKGNARVLHVKHLAHVYIAHHGKLHKVCAFAVHIGAAVYKHHALVVIGQHRRERGAQYALYAAYAQKRRKA